MQTPTRLLFNAFVGQLAKLNGLDPSLTVIPGELKQFAVAPVIEQRLQAKLQLGSDFLSRINVVPVAAQQGARVGVGVGRSLAGRTDTAAGHRRNPTDPTKSDTIDQYFCKKTDYDYSWGYTLLDAWSHRPEFQQLVRDSVLVQKAEDVITIGFNGVDAAVETNRTTFALLQDVNYGWLYKMRTYAPSRVMSHGTKDNLKVYVSDTGTADYVNLDALVFDAIGNLIHERYRTATDLVVIVGSDLVQEKYFKIISAAGDKATEQVARDIIMSSRQLGGKVVQDYLVFGTGYVEVKRNTFRDPLRLVHSMARYTRRGVSPGQFWWVPGANDPVEFPAGSVVQIMQPDVNQEIYGVPEYISALQAALLNEAATLFRRRYYLNGSHAGYILYATGDIDVGDTDKLKKAMRESKGPGNFRNLFVHAPNGKENSIKILPVTEAGAKDEFLGIKTATRDDVLAAHRVPPSLLGIVPAQGSQLGKVSESVDMFFELEIAPIQAACLEINDQLGMEAVKFLPRSVAAK